MEVAAISRDMALAGVGRQVRRNQEQYVRQIAVNYPQPARSQGKMAVDLVLAA